MNAKKIGVFFLSKPNFNEFALKFMVLNLNKVQSYFEFEFPEHEGYLEVSTSCDEQFANFRQFTSKYSEKYFVGITTSSFKENLFWTIHENMAIITTDCWGKYFAPPSVFEYIMCSMIGSLVQMVTDKEGNTFVGSHRETRGCLLDYGFFKDDFRVKIPTGLICDNCRIAIKESVGEEFLSSIEKMWDFKTWVGEPDNPESVAYNMKKFFKVDLYKDTGFYKSGWDKIKESFTEFPKEILLVTATAVITALITYIVTKFIV